MRLVWRGGDVTVFDIPVAVGSLAALARSSELEARVLALARAGEGDEAITAALEADGHRSPMADRLLPSTVKAIRLRHGVMAKRSQSHPRRIDGCLTVPQLASRLGVEPHWIYDRIHKGTIAVRRDADTGLYLFPDRPETLGELEKLKAGAQTGSRSTRTRVLEEAPRCAIEEATDVGIEHPIHALAHDRRVQRLQRLVRVPPRPEAVGETEEVGLVDGAQHLGDRALDDLVLQGRYAERPAPPSAFGMKTRRTG